MLPFNRQKVPNKLLAQLWDCRDWIEGLDSLFLKHDAG